MAKVFHLTRTSEQEIGDRTHKVRLRTWDRSNLSLPGGATHFGCSLDGGITIETADFQLRLAAGGFFRIHGEAVIQGRFGFALSMKGNGGFTQVSGPQT